MPEIILQPRYIETACQDRADTNISASDLSLRPLLRLRQLAAEIQRALVRGEFDIMSQASALLAPALADWTEARHQMTENDPRIAPLSEETQGMLAQCEQAVQAAMNQMRGRHNLIRQHQRRLQRVRSQRQARTGRVLDDRR